MEAITAHATVDMMEMALLAQVTKQNTNFSNELSLITMLYFQILTSAQLTLTIVMTMQIVLTPMEVFNAHVCLDMREMGLFAKVRS